MYDRMKRPNITKLCLSNFLCTAVLEFCTERPHIILIFTDQQNVNAMSAAGNPFLCTPNMDALANDGIRFTNVYCTSPVSGPSRASIVTGLMAREAELRKIIQNERKVYKPLVTCWVRMAIGLCGQGNGIFQKSIRSAQKTALNICMVLNYSLFGTHLTNIGCWERKQILH